MLRRRGVAAIVVVTLATGLALTTTAATAAPDTEATGSGTGISWPKHQALPRFAQPTHLDVADLEGASTDVSLTLTTLQGIVNRSRPQIYLTVPADEGRTTWLETLDVPYDTVADPLSLVKKYKSAVRGIIVYDPAVPATVNVASTMAGLQGAIIASPSLAETLTAAPYKLKIVDDLRGDFADDLSAYTWAVENLWPKTTHRMLVGLDPNLGFVRDYAVANKAFVVWLATGDAAEEALLERILADIPPNSPYLGWFKSGGVGGESDGTELLSRHGLYVLAADFLANETVFAGARAPIESAPPPVDAPALENKIYVTFSMTEGDNLQYNQRRMRLVWDDPGRGSVPINWSTNPLLLDSAPTMLSHYQQTATPNDLLVAGPSGAGYAYPTAWPADTLRTFTGQTGKYMDATGMDIAVILNRVDEADVPMSEQTAQQYVDDVEPLGLFKDWTNHTETSLIAGGSTPQSISYLTSSVAEAQAAIAESAAGWDGTSPLFLSIGILAWNMLPTDVATVADSLGPEYSVVRGDQHFTLIREANNLPV